MLLKDENEMKNCADVKLRWRWSGKRFEGKEQLWSFELWGPPSP